MRLKDSFVTHDNKDGQVMVDVSGQFSGIIKSNKSAAFVVDMLKEEHTEEELVEALFAKYDAPMEVLESDVHGLIAKLRKAGALTE
ncbi:MAG: PqqD family protein [Lachnospiraceae bacterium]|nr:PqqD family protein [Lachnospiraceae bacterium]